MKDERFDARPAEATRLDAARAGNLEEVGYGG